MSKKQFIAFMASQAVIVILLATLLWKVIAVTQKDSVRAEVNNTVDVSAASYGPLEVHLDDPVQLDGSTIPVEIQNDPVPVEIIR